MQVFWLRVIILSILLGFPMDSLRSKTRLAIYSGGTAQDSNLLPS